LGLYKKLFKNTAIYGLATVIPRMFSFLLVPIYTQLLPREEYGQVTIIFSWMIFFNVILAYGMETSFFRFYNKESDKNKVVETSTVSIFTTSLFFLALSLLFRNTLAAASGINVQYITYTIWILVLDAFVIVPFSNLRARQKPGLYALLKVGNVVVNLSLNLFFLLVLPKMAADQPGGFWASIFQDSNYMHLKWEFDWDLWKRMLRYGLPILVAGIAFAINEQFDKILLGKLLPANVAHAQVGVYAACYKLGLFMVLYRTAYTLGIEPFFFSHANDAKAPETYATVTKYFVIFGSFIQLVVLVFADLFKELMIRDTAYWEAMKVVPLIILANFFLGIYTNLSVWYKLIDKTHIGAYISLIGAAVTLALNFLLIPNYGYYGSAVATIAAYGSMMLISYVLGKRYYPIPYDGLRIGSYLGSSIVFSTLSFYFFRENYVVGTGLIVAFLAIIYYFEKDTLVRLLRSPKN
jgi:O-antigen/teichoic acid export membrane protein